MNLNTAIWWRDYYDTTSYCVVPLARMRNTRRYWKKTIWIASIYLRGISSGLFSIRQNGWTYMQGERHIAMGTSIGFPGNGTEFLPCSKDISNSTYRCRNVIKCYRALRRESFSTAALPSPRLLGRSFVLRVRLPGAVYTRDGRHSQPQRPGLSTLRYSRLGRLFCPAALSFTGRAGPLLGHRPLRVVQEEGHQPRRHCVNLGDVNSDIRHHHRPIHNW